MLSINTVTFPYQGFLYDKQIALYWLFFLEVFYFTCFRAFNYIIVVPKDIFTFFNLAFPVICFYSWYVFAKIFFNVQLKSCEDKSNHSSIGS